MARTVREIMNPEVLTLRRNLPLADARHQLRAFGVGAAPVVDEARRPVGVLSIKDILDVDGIASDRMSRPVLCVSCSALVENAARQLAATRVHHLVVVDGAGGTVGMLSTLDLLRALLGMPTPHPASFPHWDASTETSWTDDAFLDEDHADQAPTGPGVLVLSTSFVGEPESVIWVESCEDVRERALAMVTWPMQQEPPLLGILEGPGLRFRAARLVDEAKRARVLATLRDRVDHAPPPGAT
jgi:hypothetical protein